MYLEQVIDRRLTLPYIKTSSCLNHNLLLPVTKKEVNMQSVTQTLQKYQTDSLRNWSYLDFNPNAIAKCVEVIHSKSTMLLSPLKNKIKPSLKSEQKKFYKNLEARSTGWKDAKFDLTCYNKESSNFD